MFDMFGLEHLRSVMFPALGWEVDEVEPVLLLPGGRSQLSAGFSHHGQPGPVCKAGGSQYETDWLAGLHSPGTPNVMSVKTYLLVSNPTRSSSSSNTREVTSLSSITKI